MAILNAKPDDAAVLSNVGAISDFKIRSTAKSFQILSSSLYSNKIRAIVRELSCNAIDSHIAAGKKDVPFEAHFPTYLEPYFYIRDFGVGLTHDQVTNIYTTYFESTKTGSNDFIGALGLGSKTPFSYTTNFTVVAIKDGRKATYTAFINDNGVPSIALMAEETTREHNGVEVRFGVELRNDFNKFVEEAKSVYAHFPIKPIIKGQQFTIESQKYAEKDIIPGVHQMAPRSGYYDTRAIGSVAIMGNICYPIKMPEKALTPDLEALLTCDLEMHFGVGDLDFQASREGLSYIPQTVEAIKSKLVAVRDQLLVHLEKQVDVFTSVWDKNIFLNSKTGNMWSAPIAEYRRKTSFPFSRHQSLKIHIEKLKQFNIEVRGFLFDGGQSFKALKMEQMEDYVNKKMVAVFEPDVPCVFVRNDTNVGVFERAKYHYRQNAGTMRRSNVYIIDPIDKKKPADFVGFFKAIHEPDPKNILLGSALDKKPVAAAGPRMKNVSIMHLDRSGRSSGYYGPTGKDYVWSASRDLTDVNFPINRTYYYVPLSGYDMISKYGNTESPKDFAVNIKHRLGIKSMESWEVYGVRKTDIPEVQKRKNWVNLEDAVKDQLAALTSATVAQIMIDHDPSLRFEMPGCLSKIDPAYISAKSPFLAFFVKYTLSKKQTRNHFDRNMLARYHMQYTKMAALPNATVDSVRKDVEDFTARYPLYHLLHNNGKVTEEQLHVYIHMVDTVYPV